MPLARNLPLHPDLPASPPQSARPSPPGRTGSTVQRLDNVSLRHAIDAYREFCRRGDPRSLDAFTSDSFNRWTARWGARKLRSLSAFDLHEHETELRRRGHSADDIAREKGLLARFHRWAARNGLSDEALVAEIFGGTFAAWTGAEQRRLLETCRGLGPGSRKPPPRYLYPLVLLALRTGLRLEDLLRLEWRHVDPELEGIRMTAAETSSGTALEIPLQRDARSLLAALGRRLPPSGASPSILAAMGAPFTGGRPDAERILEDFGAVRERAGIRAGDFFSLRLGFLRNCASAAIPRVHAARLSGCADGDLLARIYSEVEKGRTPPASGPGGRGLAAGLRRVYTLGP